MSQPNRKRLRLETLRTQRLEAAGSKYVELEMDDEKVIKFTRQNWWPLALVKKLQQVQNDATKDTEASGFDTLDGMVAVLREVSDDKELFDELHAQMTVGDFQDILKEVMGDGLPEGESSSSSN
ncbi:hypothetical protein [Streptomyces sp. CA-106131]|jgi:hypothetical protein|uniref:hypothetical protein n=1 Tax=Streptomyces sp. CA-106131 TaxID=3240045 RepID=UPI003D92DE83